MPTLVHSTLQRPSFENHPTGWLVALWSLFCLASTAAELDIGKLPPPADRSVDFVRDHWAFKPVVRPNVPMVKNHRWPRNSIDNFIFARLEKDGLSPAPEADRVTLMRRLSFDLIGLPPTPEEVRDFVSDPRSKAYEKLVERLLASPHYGERWARHWLDVVRFAESHGFEMNQTRPNAWPYRDYVIRSFNEDKPYNQFVIEQLAGDALGADEATGFIVGGPWDQVKSPDINLTAQQRMDELHDMVATTGSTFLGLTVGCARCHNHKFDPISQVDYYALQAIFAGVQHGERPRRPADYDSRMAQAEDLRKLVAMLEAQLAHFEPLADPTLGATPRFKTPNARENTELFEPIEAKLVRFTIHETVGHAEPCIDELEIYAAGENPRNVALASGGAKATASGTYPNSDLHKLEHINDGKVGNSQSWISNQAGQGWVQLEFPDKVVINKILWGRDREQQFNDRLATNYTIEAGLAPGLLQRVAGRPKLRPAVYPRLNVERFAPIQARSLRFTILATTDAEPCLDELEIYPAEGDPGNVALASLGAKVTASGTYPNSDIHKLEHLNDGRWGNGYSWISSERGKGWVQLDLPESIRINKIVWSRDREEKFTDRLATNYKIEISNPTAGDWLVVAASNDRESYVPGTKPKPGYSPAGLTQIELDRLNQLLAEKQQLEMKIKELTTLPAIYAGKFEPPGPTYRLQRGEALQKREPVTPGGIKAFGAGLSLPTESPDQPRRLALAKWIAQPENPFTARVMVNRIWQYHFGHGLVDTPSDFGLNGARPSHPELLDWLASEFVARAWSVKAIHRLILESNTYRQSSEPNPRGLERDAAGRLLWRFPPRRLEAEPLRDSILCVCGNLDLKMGGPGFDLFEPNNNYVKVYNPKKEFGPPEWRRMVYQAKPRMQLDDTFGSFDCPDAGQIAPRRTSSTTPLQALNLLNSRFMVEQAELFSQRLRQDAGAKPSGQVRRAFWLTFSREPTRPELEAGEKVVAEHGLMAFCRAILNANEFVFVF